MPAPCTGHTLRSGTIQGRDGALRRPLSGAFPSAAGQLPIPLANKRTAPAGTSQRDGPYQIRVGDEVTSLIIYIPQSTFRTPHLK
jgi:hypothetical protein